MTKYESVAKELKARAEHYNGSMRDVYLTDNDRSLLHEAAALLQRAAEVETVAKEAVDKFFFDVLGVEFMHPGNAKESLERLRDLVKGQSE